MNPSSWQGIISEELSLTKGIAPEQQKADAPSVGGIRHPFERDFLIVTMAQSP
jgi:hypothetical protein